MTDFDWLKMEGDDEPEASGVWTDVDSQALREFAGSMLEALEVARVHVRHRGDEAEIEQVERAMRDCREWESFADDAEAATNVESGIPGFM